MRPLGIVRELSTDKVAMLARIESYDLGFVLQRIRIKNAVPRDDIPRATLEYRRWMGLKALGFKNMEMVDQNADEIWHAHILFTQEYHDFCNMVCGHYIHHGPFSNRKAHTNVRRNFHMAYNYLYGPYVTP